MILVLVGPTAVGKSALALAVAERFVAAGRPAEIISADSMLLYRGMDIGTAKPDAAELARVPHHLVDVLDVTETSTVADFQGVARAAIADCTARGVLPVLVGGSALYVRAVLDHFEFPGTDPEVRARLEADLAAVGSRALHDRLAAVDPAAAALMEPANGRRIVRALEVVTLTGRPYAASLPPRTYALPDVVQVGLDIDRETLNRRIDDRVSAMFAAGLVEEVRSLLGRGLRDGVTASRGLGYRQVVDHLDGLTTEEQARRLTAQATRRFARRQDSWFRLDERISWLAYDRPDLVDATYALAGGSRTEAGSSDAAGRTRVED